MNVIMACPSCEMPATTTVDRSADWQCDHCDHRLHLNAAEPTLPACVVCGNHELYKRKDFPQWLGMTILVVAVILSTFAYLWYEKWLTWALLIGSAVIDGGLYLIVGDVIVCYRCEANYRGVAPNNTHQPFEISIGERYRQERIRRERLRSQEARVRSQGSGVRRQDSDDTKPPDKIAP